MDIRKYCDEDRIQVIELFRLNSPRYFAAQEEEDLLFYLMNHAANFYLIVDGDAILGCGGFNFSENRDRGIISWDIFHPEHQRKGYGSQLLYFRIKELKKWNTIKMISVRTSEQAHVFYLKRGFILKGIVENYWAEGYDLYDMEYIGKV